MDKTFRFKSTSIQVYHDRISIKQMFLSEDFKKMDIMDIRQEKNMLYIQTRRNQFKIKIPKVQAQEADALFQYLTDQKEESQTIENVKMVDLNQIKSNQRLSKRLLLFADHHLTIL